MYLCIRLFSNSSDTAGHIITILGGCVVLMPGMVLIYFLKVTHPLGAPQGVFDPLDAQGRRASKFNVYTMLAVKTYDENRKSENIFYAFLKLA